MIAVINDDYDINDVESALIQVLSLFVVQNHDKPYEVIERVVDELRDCFDDEVAYGLTVGSVTVISSDRLDSESES